MHPKLKPSKHRLIALVVISAVVLAYLLLQIFVLRPQRVEARSKDRTIENSTRVLRQKGWPLEQARLRTLLAETVRNKQTAEKKRADLLNRAGIPYQARILKRYGSPENFQRQVMRLDYQEEFKRLENFLAENRVVISPEVFKLSEDTVGVENYKLVLQLWTFQTVIETAFAKGLRVADAPLPPPETWIDGQKPARVSDIGAMAIIPYLPARHIETPYLLRIPIRVRLAGTMEEVQSFLLAAGSGDVFFTVDHLEASKPIPPHTRYNNRRVECVVECSTFYVLDSESGRKMMKKEAPKPMPRGA